MGHGPLSLIGIFFIEYCHLWKSAAKGRKMKVWLNKSDSLEKNGKEKILKTVEKILKDKKRDGEISITFVNKKDIQKLNKQYRKVDSATDVLSFDLSEDKYIIGDIYIAKEIAKKQAQQSGHSLFEEIFLLIIHGVLHLLDYDHNTPKESQEMRKEEKKYLGE